jgi:hypothetical protein
MERAADDRGPLHDCDADEAHSLSRDKMTMLPTLLRDYANG